MIITLQEAIDLLANEIGVDSFTETGAVDGSGTFSTSGVSTNLVGTSTGNLTVILASNDYVVIDQVAYKIVSVSVGSLVISDAIELADASWQYVKALDYSTFATNQKKRNQSLGTSTRLIESVKCDTDPIPDNVKFATALLTSKYYIGYSPSYNINVTSEKIGDLSTSYDLNRLQDPIPKDIIDILGDCYIGGSQPAFFSK